MSEELNPRELPHQLLLRRYGISIGQLNSNAQQLKKDLDRTLQLVLNKAKNGAVKLTPATQSKINTYDRYICDGVFEYLESQENVSEQEVEKIEEQMDSKREDVAEKMEEIHEEAIDNQNTNPSTSETQTETPTPKEESSTKVGLGFWDWS
jgi:hypothetical protein